VARPVEPGGLTIGAVSLRERLHMRRPTSDFTEVVQVHSGPLGGDSGVVLVEKLDPNQSRIRMSGDFIGDGNGPTGTNLGNDWAAVAFQLR
jgi:hypothetical protein